MNRNITALLLIILAIGIYFMHTQSVFDQTRISRQENDKLQEAIENAKALIEKRKLIEADYKNIAQTDRDKLEKMIPNSTDNIHLIVDITDLASKHNVNLKNIRAEILQEKASSNNRTASTSLPKASLGNVKLSFSATATYGQIQTFLMDLESSLRIIDISRFTLKANETNTYDYQIELITYWLK